MVNENRLFELLEHFIQNKIDKEAFDEMLTLLSEVERSEIEGYLTDILDQAEIDESSEFVERRVEHLHSAILGAIQAESSDKLPASSIKRLSIRRLFWFGAAASVAIFLLAIYPVFKDRFNKSDFEAPNLAADVLPGTNKATIYLDGQEFTLDGNQEGVVQDATGLQYLDGTPILPTMSSIKTIRIRTPKGGQYQMVLPDATKVWVNAETELTYASTFGITDRNVSLIGEAYFDVTTNSKLPFKVKAQDQEAIVTGTVFNINAYLDESFAKTTLVEGGLKVRSENRELVLKPNEQAISEHSRNVFLKQHIDALAATSWKDGIIDLHEVSLDVCMRIIGRWYDIDIRYEDGIPDVILGGKMSRGVKLSTFLEFLQHNFDISTELQSSNTLLIKKNNKHINL